jgi:hypothetical protein
VHIARLRRKLGDDPSSPPYIHTGRRALQIARQAVLAGMGLSVAAMGVAASVTCRPSSARCSRRSSTWP